MAKPLQFMIFQLLVWIVVSEGSRDVTEIAGFQNETVAVDSISQFPYTVIIDKISDIPFNYSYLVPSNASNAKLHLMASLSDNSMAELRGNTIFPFDSETMYGNISVKIEGKLPGRTTLYINVVDLSGQTAAESTSNYGSRQNLNTFPFKLYVQRELRVLDTAFTIVIILLVTVANIGMGCKIDLEVVKSELKRPVAPIIGLCSQFIFMPLIAFAFAYNLDLDPGVALGFFALGCSPGGSASNMYTHFLEGNVSLSVTMTLVSTFSALALIPMWLFTLGQLIYNEGDVKIPYQNIIFSLVGVIMPIIIGLFLQRKFPKVARLAIRIVKYVMIVFVIFILTVGIYANIYIFYLVNFEVLISAALLPYLGFIFGGLTALIIGQKRPNVVAIAVETGIQNTGIPILLLQVSLSGPDKDTAIVSPVISALFTPLPLLIAVMFVQGRAFLRRRREAKKGGPVPMSAEENGDYANGSSDEPLTKSAEEDETETFN